MTHRLLGRVLLCGVIISAAASCSSVKKYLGKDVREDQVTDNSRTETPVVTAPAASAAHDLDGLLGEWSITEVAGKKVVVNGENHPKLTIAQVPGQTDVLRLIGYNGCNWINGDWRVSGGKISAAGEFLSSLMACADAPYERDVTDAINMASSYRLDGPDNLTIYSSTGKVLMKLRSRNLSFLNGAWEVTTIHGNRVPASADVKVVIDIDECKIHGNAACNVLNGEIVVNLDKGDGIEFKNLATSRMMCPDIATEREFLLALEEVDTAVRGSDSSIALLKDSDGKTVIELKRLPADKLTESEGND